MDYSNQTETVHFIVMTDEAMNEQKRKLLTHLYQPFIGIKAVNLYLILSDMVQYGEIESEINDHYKIMTLLKVKKMEKFLEIRSALEASCLLETYRNDILTIYVLKPVLKPSEFFDDIILSTMLKNNIGTSEFESLQKELLVTRYDLNHFQNITKSFDDVYSVEYLESQDEYDKWWTSIKKSRPHLTKNHIDYEALLSYVEPLDIIKEDILKSSKFFDTINSVAFCYGLNPKELATALKMTANLQQTFDEKGFIKAVKKLYDAKLSEQKVSIQMNKSSSKDNELVKLLENVNHSQLVEARYGKGLVSSEIEILETLHRKYGFNHGFINVLLIYILANTNGSVPALNYFLKVANDWYRKGITTTVQALDYIENPNASKYNKTYTKTPKKIAKTPAWVEEHLKETKEQTSKNIENESINDLEDFFNK